MVLVLELKFTTSPGGGGWSDIYEINAILNSFVVEVEVWVELGKTDKGLVKQK